MKDTSLKDDTGFTGPAIELPGPGGLEEYPIAAASRVASCFAIENPVEAFDFPDKGNINQHTYLLTGGSSQTKEFLLQQINQEVFTRPASVMKAMISCIEAQRQGLSSLELPKGIDWEAISLIPTREGDDFLCFTNRRGTTYWRVMKKIPNCHTFKSLSELPTQVEQLRIAEDAGRGLAVYCDLTAEMDISGLENPLPGYRETGVYYAQLKSVLEGHQTLEEAAEFLPTDETIRQSTEQHFRLHIPLEEHRRRLKHEETRRFVKLALDHEDFGMSLLHLMDCGKIRRVAIHGDTKLDNFLFSLETGRVRALVDLDTIMPHTWLADWGDMARSLTNVAGEKERDLSKVDVDMKIYEALVKGFLSTTTRLPRHEIQLMPEAVQVIALELGLRFLTDYLRGDSYFKLSATDAPDLNRVRGLAQLTLFERLKEREEETRDCIDRWSR